MSTVLSILNEPWAMPREKKCEVDAIYMRHRSGKRMTKADLAELEASLGRPLGNQREYQIIDGAAVVPVEGVLAKRMDMFQAISGGTPSTKILETFNQALNDPAVEQIVLLVDSPGGTVDGTKAIADAVFAARGQKPITALVDGMAASAAYWIASACDKVYLKDSTTFAGSIGVVVTHVDVSGAEAAEGVKTTEITAGKFKRVDSAYAPLSEDGRQTLQDRVDAIYNVFLSDVGRNRGNMPPQQVHEQMADGRLFMGQDAINAGLADGIQSLDSIILGNKKPKSSTSKKGPNMDISILKTEHPDVYNAIFQEGAASAKAAIDSAAATAATAERERIFGLLDNVLPGHEAEATAFARDGKTTHAEASASYIQAERGVRQAEAKQLETGAPKVLPGGGAKGPGAEENDLRARWDNSAAVRSLYGNFEAYEKAQKSYDAKTQEGTIRAFAPATDKQ